MSGLKAPEKAHITATCERFITNVLKPRFLPVLRPTEFNYPVDIQGKWHGTRYRFLQRYRSGFTNNRGEEFDAPFVRLDWIAPDALTSNGIVIPAPGYASTAARPSLRP